MLKFDDRAKRPELVFGLVGAAGCNLHHAANCLHDALQLVGYAAHTIHMSALLKSFDFGLELVESPEEDRLHSYMTAGNTLRERTGFADALARTAIAKIREIRESRGGQEHPIPETAYILNSLKHEKEVDQLRRVYGPGFFLVGAYSPTEERIAALATKLAGSHQSADSEKFLEKASKLIERDQFERHNPNGQQVRETFSKADFFVAVDDKVRAAGDIRRFIEIIFGHPNHTPSQDELSMFHAHAAATRSSSLARQVGAVVVSQAGEIISTGTNEAPKAGGGFYWPSDAVHDKRDFVLGHDSNTQMKIRAVREILACLGENGWLSDHSGVAKDGVPDEAVGNACEILKDCRIMNLTEFGREVHAEMAALLDAARRGVPVKDCILYCTTFPCHNCAKHIIASGICRVYYIEPYPKSLATELHGDAIAIEKVDRDRVPFLPFLGVGARRYLDLFSMVNSEGWSIRRKHSDGTAIEWDSSNSVPRLPMWDGSYTDHETASLTAFAEKLSAARADADLERGE